MATGKAHDSKDDERRVASLATLFVILYFVQGINEPSEGLLAQPTRSLLSEWGYSTEKVAWFMATLALPWSIKPIYGILTDFVPLFGTRRRSWLILTSFVTAASLTALYVFLPSSHEATVLLAWLLVPTVGVAFGDVIVDALMVEEGQPRGITGLLQSVQWAAIYSSTIIIGFLGGYLSEHKLQPLGFLIAGLSTVVSFVLALAAVREPRRSAIIHDNPLTQRQTVRGAVRDLWRGFKHPAILAIGAFLFLWNFNPFSGTVKNFYIADDMGLGQQFYGNMISIEAVASVVASVVYPLYCRHLTVGQLVHLSIVTGILATLGYWGLVGMKSAAVISFAMGFVYMTSVIIQLDLAARVCDVATAGTTFALLMSLMNFSFGLSAGLGGTIYESFKAAHGPRFAFNVVVGVGALFTSCCWLLVPTIRRYCEPAANEIKAPAPDSATGS